MKHESDYEIQKRLDAFEDFLVWALNVHSDKPYRNVFSKDEVCQCGSCQELERFSKEQKE
jgi:hypothetical protein